MAEIEISIDKDSINQAVTQAVVDSVIGEQMQKAITEALKPTGYGRDSAVSAVMHQEVQKAIRKVIEEDYSDVIKDAVKKKLHEHVDSVEMIVEAGIDHFTQQISNRR